VSVRDLLPVAGVAAAAALATDLIAAPSGALIGAALATGLGAAWSRLTGSPAGVVQAPVARGRPGL
jgi:hypothetical protein